MLVLLLLLMRLVAQQQICCILLGQWGVSGDVCSDCRCERWMLLLLLLIETATWLQPMITQ
jgi:hypothetical protein